MSITIDKLSSYDFIAQVYNQVTPDSLRNLGTRLEKKSARFRLYFDQSQIDSLDREKLIHVADAIFSIRRVIKKWTDEQISALIQEIKQLIYGEQNLDVRFDLFCKFSEEELKIQKPFELASELLHFTKPEVYHLWAKWMWEPKGKTGGIPLMVNEEFNISEKSYGEQYIVIGEVVEKINQISEEIGIREPNQEPSSVFETDIYICAIFAVYMYTVTRMRMTKEFNTILPSLIELTERLLGIRKIKGEIKFR